MQNLYNFFWEKQKLKISAFLKICNLCLRHQCTIVLEIKVPNLLCSDFFGTLVLKQKWRWSTWNLAKFWLQANLHESKIIKNPSIFLATSFEPCVEIWWFNLNFGRTMAIENFKRPMILNVFISMSRAFWLYIASKKMGVGLLLGY